MKKPLTGVLTDSVNDFVVIFIRNIFNFSEIVFWYFLRCLGDLPGFLVFKKMYSHPIADEMRSLFDTASESCPVSSQLLSSMHNMNSVTSLV